jgi:uncharacterized damage-inducible protein DinB
MVLNFMNSEELGFGEKTTFEEICAVLRAFSREQQLLVGATSKWSAKDVLSHLVYWENETLARLRSMRDGSYIPQSISKDELHTLNEAQVEARSQRNLESLLDEFSATRLEIRKLYTGVLTEQYQSEPRLKMVFGHCVRHCGHHLAQLKAWQRSLNKSEEMK